MSGVTLRVGRADDGKAMHRLDVVCFESVFRFSLRAMRRFAGEAGAVVLVAERDGVLVGFVIVSVAGDEGYVVTLDVDPALRRAGVARALMERAVADVAAAGGVVVRLHVHVGNLGAVRFYEGLGFKGVGMGKGFYGDGVDAWVYERVLAGE